MLADRQKTRKEELALNLDHLTEQAHVPELKKIANRRKEMIREDLLMFEEMEDRSNIQKSQIKRLTESKEYYKQELEKLQS